MERGKGEGGERERERERESELYLSPSLIEWKIVAAVPLPSLLLSFPPSSVQSLLMFGSSHTYDVHRMSRSSNPLPIQMLCFSYTNWGILGPQLGGRPTWEHPFREPTSLATFSSSFYSNSGVKQIRLKAHTVAREGEREREKEGKRTGPFLLASLRETTTTTGGNSRVSRSSELLSVGIIGLRRLLLFLRARKCSSCSHLLSFSPPVLHFDALLLIL